MVETDNNKIAVATCLWLESRKTGNRTKYYEHLLTMTVDERMVHRNEKASITF